MASKEHNSLHSALRKQLAKLGRPKLAKKCQEQNLSIYGTKGDLVKRLIHAMSTSAKKSSTQRCKTQTQSTKRSLFKLNRNGSVDEKPGSRTHKSPRSPSASNSSSTTKKHKTQSKTKQNRPLVVGSERTTPNKAVKTKKKLKPKASRKSIQSTDMEPICNDAAKPSDTAINEHSETKITNDIYEIFNHKDRPFLNGKHCKIVEMLDRHNDAHLEDENKNDNEQQCKVTLLSNNSQQIIPRENLQRVTSKHRHSNAEMEDAYMPILNLQRKPVANRRRGSVDQNKHIETAMKSIAPIEDEADHVEVYAVGVFVDYQMILKLWIDSTVALLFGTQYNNFKTECLTFLEEISCDGDMDVDGDGQDGQDDVKENGVQSQDGKHWKILDKFMFLHYVCNDKHIVLLTESGGDGEDADGDDERKAQCLSAISAIDCCIISGCNAYKEMPSGLDMIQKIFEMHDVYGFGEINEREFNNFLSALTAKHQIKSSSSEALFAEIDVDKIKAITFEQFATFMSEQKQVLWKLLLELATEYELELNIKLEMYQSVLSKIHKLVLIMNELSDSMSWRTARQHRVWRERMVPYVEFIKQGQQVIDRKMVHYRDHKKHNKRKSLESIAMFIHNNMPNID
eukprot:CAMPEP_0197052640 /NCGR_PEP_ID=MMETSP1384-20130603/27075_1 /TAXON_ID=29189 /ORGANISM="Ammonia sp." /LENGTH=624 /DNA_ID=CAMNT_0042485425 /DNA_START=49 /DNA_END=1923 /DNA_ORIENTATION=-